MKQHTEASAGQAGPSKASTGTQTRQQYMTRYHQQYMTRYNQQYKTRYNQQYKIQATTQDKVQATIHDKIQSIQDKIQTTIHDKIWSTIQDKIQSTIYKIQSTIHDKIQSTSKLNYLLIDHFYIALFTALEQTCFLCMLGCLRVSIIHRTLRWTTGPLTCVHDLSAWVYTWATPVDSLIRRTF